MSQENVKLVQEWFERWNRGDRDFSRAEVLHPDFQVISRYQGESFRGLKGLRRWMQETQSQEWKVVVDEWRDTDDLEAARRFHDHSDRTGEPLWDVIDSEIAVYDHDIPDAGTYHGLAGFTEWLMN